MTALQLRDARIDDAETVLRMNDAEVQWTSPMDAARLTTLASLAAYYRVAVINTRVAGFVLAMRSGAGYDNDNIAWFEERFTNFLYVDRIVVEARFAGQQVGRALYRDVFARAAALGLDSVVCEFNLTPPNRGSAMFHERMGFETVGRREIDGGAKAVSMLRRRLDC